MKVKSQTELELRQEKVETPQSMEELTEYIESLLKINHDYGTCVYAMSMAATATFNYVASSLDVTGFQASCADLDVLRRTRHIEGPFILLKGEDLLYPQYDLHQRLEEAIGEWGEWLKEQAKERLASDETYVAESVLQHWKKLIEEDLN